MRVARIVPWRRRIAAADARNTWSERHGTLIVVEHAGVRGLGEAAPLPGFAGTGAAHAAMRFALETAVLDAVARARGVSLAELFAALVGGPAPVARVPVNALVAGEDAARAALARGITTLKVKVGPDGHAAFARLAAAVPGVTWRLDANQSWPRDEVEARLRALAATAARIEYVEEPAAGLGPRLRAPLALPVALDESLAAPDRDGWLDRAVASGAVGALVLKPTVLGGLAACADLARRARRHGVEPVVTHALEGPVATAACAELARALGGTRPAGLDRHATLAAWGVTPSQLAGAAVVAAASPGLGLDVDELVAAAEAP